MLHFHVVAFTKKAWSISHRQFCQKEKKNECERVIFIKWVLSWYKFIFTMSVGKNETQISLLLLYANPSITLFFQNQYCFGEDMSF